jgi:hypothetical protein
MDLFLIRIGNNSIGPGCEVEIKLANALQLACIPAAIDVVRRFQRRNCILCQGTNRNNLFSKVGDDLIEYGVSPIELARVLNCIDKIDLALSTHKLYGTTRKGVTHMVMKIEQIFYESCFGNGAAR